MLEWLERSTNCDSFFETNDEKATGIQSRRSRPILLKQALVYSGPCTYNQCLLVRQCSLAVGCQLYNTPPTLLGPRVFVFHFPAWPPNVGWVQFAECMTKFVNQTNLPNRKPPALEAKHKKKQRICCRIFPLALRAACKTLTWCFNRGSWLLFDFQYGKRFFLTEGLLRLRQASKNRRNGQGPMRFQSLWPWLLPSGVADYWICCALFFTIFLYFFITKKKALLFKKCARMHQLFLCPYRGAG